MLMRHKLPLAAIAGALIALLLMVAAPAAGARVLRVGTYHGVRGQYKSIQAAVDAAKPGDWVLIHVGFAMSKISEQDAMEQMRLLRALGETEQAMEEVRGYGLENDGGQEGLSQ